MLPRSAVSGVRNSCEASARKRRSRSRARSRLASIALSVSASRPTSSFDGGGGSRRRGIARSLDLGGRRGRPRDRTQRTPLEQEHGDRGERGRRDAREHEKETEVRQRVLDVVLRRCDDDGAARRRATERGERRDIDTQPLACRAST